MNTEWHGWEFNMDNGGKLQFEKETFHIIGSAMEVLNTLGHGLLEKPYENAFTVELGLKNIPFKQQARYDIFYKGTMVGQFIPDLIVFDSIVVDTKVIERVGNIEKCQILNHLKITGLRVGLILNFKHPKLEWEGLVS